jgi:DNA-binding LacI/PurR family transcriptional regulator
MTTMKDVAKEAGVSMITVSRVINCPDRVKETTKNKVLLVMDKLDFLPNYAAKALAEKSTGAIHLYVPKYIKTSDIFIMNLIAGVSEELSNAYYPFLIRRDLDFKQRCDGVIVMGLKLSEEENIKEKLNVPFVLFGKSNLEIDCIDIDNIQGAYMMTEHIISCGHKKIGFIMIKTDQRYAEERMEGYKLALKDNHIEFEKNLVSYVENIENDSYDKSLDLIQREKPTAIFCCNDFIAVSAYRAAKDLNLQVPKDLSIAGFDGLTYDLLAEKPITTVRQPVYDAGRNLAKRLLERLKNPDLDFEKKVILPEMIIRNTIDKP